MMIKRVIDSICGMFWYYVCWRAFNKWKWTLSYEFVFAANEMLWVVTVYLQDIYDWDDVCSRFEKIGSPRLVLRIDYPGDDRGLPRELHSVGGTGGTND